MKEATVLYKHKGRYHFERRTIFATFEETDPEKLGLPSGAQVILIIGQDRGANYWLEGKLQEMY